jgi:glutamine amidotransferase
VSVTVVDCGASNTASMLFALERLGVRAHLTADPAAIADAERIILPGVGHAAYVMQRLGAHGLIEPLRAFPRPLFGVCLGMQLLFSETAEGEAACLGLIPGRVEALSATPERPVPHMGWNSLDFGPGHPLLDGIAPGQHVYFVHSYAVSPGAHALATASYGSAFTAVTSRGNVMGAQFHPERSGPVGARILRNFLDLPC